MPLFTKKKSPKPEIKPDNSAPEPLVFHCQLAHGSPTGVISGFSTVPELFKQISKCYEIPVTDILYCTINTHKIDMSKMLDSQIAMGDMIFVHVKGRAKEFELKKTTNSLGLTISDNGNGGVIIRGIQEGTAMGKFGNVFAGDQIERLNGESMHGKRHIEVAKALKSMPLESTITLRLIEPLKSVFQELDSSSQQASGQRNNGTGKTTLRFKANGQWEIESETDDAVQKGLEAINKLLAKFLGIDDAKLANQIYNLGADKQNSMEFADAVDNSDLEVFGFTDDLIIEMWGAITDAKRQSGKKAEN